MFLSLSLSICLSLHIFTRWVTVIEMFHLKIKLFFPSNISSTRLFLLPSSQFPPGYHRREGWGREIFFLFPPSLFSSFPNFLLSLLLSLKVHKIETNILCCILIILLIVLLCILSLHSTLPPSLWCIFKGEERDKMVWEGEGKQGRRFKVLSIPSLTGMKPIAKGKKVIYPSSSPSSSPSFLLSFLPSPLFHLFLNPLKKARGR